jgi:hypothetical protein
MEDLEIKKEQAALKKKKIPIIFLILDFKN